MDGNPKYATQTQDDDTQIQGSKADKAKNREIPKQKNTKLSIEIFSKVLIEKAIWIC